MSMMPPVRPPFRDCGHVLKRGEGLLACPECKRLEWQLNHEVQTDAPKGWFFGQWCEKCPVGIRVTHEEASCGELNLRCPDCFLAEHLRECTCAIQAEIAPVEMLYKMLEKAMNDGCLLVGTCSGCLEYTEIPVVAFFGKHKSVEPNWQPWCRTCIERDILIAQAFRVGRNVRAHFMAEMQDVMNKQKLKS